MTEVSSNLKPSLLNARVVVVSAYGRGHSLAVNLKRLGLNVELLDISENLGNWVLEEAEGPFGIFQNEDMDQSQYERLIEEDPPQTAQNGFALWLRSGPVELKGPLTKSRLKSLGVESSTQDILLGGAGGLEASQKVNSKLSRKKEFSDQWLLQVAANFSSSVFTSNDESLDHNRPSSLMSSLLLRYPSRPGHQKSLNWCARQGVDVKDRVQILDLSKKESAGIGALEIRQGQSEKSQIVNLDQLIWCLSSEETKLMSEKICSLLFPYGVLEPDWVWTRYRVAISEGFVRNNLPAHCLLIERLDEPWAHSNFAILMKTGSPDLFDIWVRLPNTQRFNKSYLEMRGEEILYLLQKRLVHLRVEMRTYPLGYDFTYAQVGPAKQGLFDPAKKAQFKTSRFRNVWFESVENRSSLGWNAQFESERKTFSELKSWWDKLVQRQAKLDQKNNPKGAEL
jgi:hypothetical protein